MRFTSTVTRQKFSRTLSFGHMFSNSSSFSISLSTCKLPRVPADAVVLVPAKQIALSRLGAFFPRYRAVSYVNLIGRFIRDDVGKSTQSELFSALWKIPANFALVVDSKITYFLRTLIGHERHFRRVSVQETSKYNRTDCWKPTLVVLIVHRCVRSRCRDLDIFCSGEICSRPSPSSKQRATLSKNISSPRLMRSELYYAPYPFLLSFLVLLMFLFLFLLDVVVFIRLVLCFFSRLEKCGLYLSFFLPTRPPHKKKETNASTRPVRRRTRRID